MTYQSTTTLNRIRAAGFCESGWRKLLAHLGKTAADDEPLALLTVLDSNGLDDVLWVLSYAMPDDRLARHFQAWCEEQALDFLEALYPDDNRIRDRTRDRIAKIRQDWGLDVTGDALGSALSARAARAALEAGAVARIATLATARDAGATARDAAEIAQEKQLRAMLAGDQVAIWQAVTCRGPRGKQE